MAAMAEEVPDVAPGDDPIRREDRSADRAPKCSSWPGNPEAEGVGASAGVSVVRYVGYLARELERPASQTTLMPGIPELLDRLEAEQGVVLGLLTGNVADGAALKLRSGGIDPDRFRVGAYGSDAGHRPELPPIAARRADAVLRP